MPVAELTDAPPVAELSDTPPSAPKPAPKRAMPDLQAQMRAQAAGREMDSGNTGLTEALGRTVFGDNPKAGAGEVMGRAAGAPFALIDSVLPHLTPPERQALAKSSPRMEKVEAGAELAGKVAPMLLPMGMAAGGGAVGKAVGLGFGAQGALSLPSTAAAAGTTFGNPKSTAGEKMLAGGELGMGIGLPAFMLGHGAMPAPTKAQIAARMLSEAPMQKPADVEFQRAAGFGPQPQIRRVSQTPIREMGEDIALEQQMNRETFPILPPSQGLPAPKISEADFPKRPKPVVPEAGTAERQPGVQEIRAAGAQTIPAIQKLFGAANINREQARVWRDAAWPDKPWLPKPGQQPPPSGTASEPPPAPPRPPIAPPPPGVVPAATTAQVLGLTPPRLEAMPRAATARARPVVRRAVKPAPAPVVAPPAAAPPAAEPVPEAAPKEPWQMTKAEWTGHEQRGTWSQFSDEPLTQAREKERAAYGAVKVAEDARKVLHAPESIRKVMTDREGALKRNQARRDADKATEQARQDFSRASRRVSGLQTHEAFIKRALERGDDVPAAVLADYPDLQAKPAPAPEPETKAGGVDTPATAQAKMRTGIAQAPKKPSMSIPGPSQKDVKTELVSRLEKAVADAKPVVPEVKALIAEEQDNIRKAKNLTVRTRAREAIGDIYKRAGVEKVTFDIPGDGTFTVWNTPEALQTVLDRANKLQTDSGKPRSVSYSGTSKEDEAAIEKILANPETPAAPVPEPAANPQQALPGAEATGLKFGGPGAADIGEKPEPPSATVGHGRDIYGIAQIVRDARAKAGAVAPVPTGQGVSAQEAVEWGRELLRNGVDPEKLLSDFEKTGDVSFDRTAVTRAHGEELAKAAGNIEVKFGSESPEYKLAFDALSKWDARTKPMDTAWHKIGQAMQGETDLDTGSFTGMQRAYKAATDKEFTPKQVKEVKEVSGKVRQADAAADTAQKKLYEEAAKPVPKKPGATEKPIDQHQSGEEWTPGQVQDLWKRAKVYIDKGFDFDDIRNKLATDLGLPVKDVTRGMIQAKSVKRMADDVWVKQKKARVLKEQARRWLYAQSIPKWSMIPEMIKSGMFRVRVGLHGTVALGTHAPALAFQPDYWKTYAQNYGRMYHMVFSPTFHEMMVQDLVRRPNFVKAQRAGLQNNPFTFEDYTNPEFLEQFQKLAPKLTAKIEKIGGAGNRGYSVLKMLRQDLFDRQWSKLPDSVQKTPALAKVLADSINHVTGVTKAKAPNAASWAFFAPRLEGSRAAWIFGDPLRAAKTGSNWKNATPEEKQFAIRQVKEKAWVLGTYMSLLAINKGILAATDSKQKVNMSDPTKGDFMKFKVAGMDASYGNAMLTMARFPVRISTLLNRQGGKLKNVVYPDEDVYTATGEYVRSQLSPAASLAVDLATKEDWQRRQLPSSNRPEPKRLRDEGIKPYTWAEFWEEQALPIPFQEAAREVWRNGMGMNPKHIMEAEQAAASTLVNVAIGGRAAEDIQPKQTQQPQPIKYLAPMP